MLSKKKNIADIRHAAAIGILILTVWDGRTDGRLAAISRLRYFQINGLVHRTLYAHVFYLVDRRLKFETSNDNEDTVKLSNYISSIARF